MELYLKHGIENLKFGMTEFQCREILGIPDREVIDSENEEINVLEYFDLKLRLSFYLGENNRLGYLRSSNPGLSFNNQILINSKIQFVNDVIFRDHELTWELEEYDFFYTQFNKENWITMHIEYGVITEVELGVPLVNEQHVWPD